MFSTTSIFTIIAIFIGLMIGFRYVDKWAKQFSAKTVKTLNWIGFTVGGVGGIIWYVMKDPIFMFITLAGIIVYFVFYDYDKREEEEAREKKGEEEKRKMLDE